jgi:hypothetical protein
LIGLDAIDVELALAQKSTADTRAKRVASIVVAARAAVVTSRADSYRRALRTHYIDGMLIGLVETSITTTAVKSKPYLPRATPSHARCCMHIDVCVVLATRHASPNGNT